MMKRIDRRMNLFIRNSSYKQKIPKQFIYELLKINHFNLAINYKTKYSTEVMNFIHNYKTSTNQGYSINVSEVKWVQPAHQTIF